MPSDKSTISLLPLYYEGHRIRTHVDSIGMIWWVAQDICAILGVEEARNVMRHFPEDEKGVYSIHTLGGSQQTLCVNEPGLYRLVFQSRKPDAETMKRWVFHEVLPTLRRTGTYTMPPAADELAPATDQLTLQGMLPPPVPHRREHAEVSWHLAAVWSLLHRTEECLTNKEIAQRTGIAERTARAHTRYLLHVGMLDLHETFPRHLYVRAEQAATRNAGVYHRLTRLTAVIEARQQF
jgi:prophage antirepressor-like protein